MSITIPIQSDDQAKEILKEIKKYFEKDKDVKFYFNIMKYDEEYRKKQSEISKLRYKNNKEVREKKLEDSKKRQESLKNDPQHIQYKRDNAKKNYYKKKLEKI